MNMKFKNKNVRLLAVMTSILLFATSLFLPVERVSAINLNNSVSYSVFSLDQDGALKKTYTLSSASVLSATAECSVIGTDTREVDFSKSGVVRIISLCNGGRLLGTGFIVDAHTIATVAHGVYSKVYGTTTNSGVTIPEITIYNTDRTQAMCIKDAKEVHIPTKYITTSAEDYNPYDYALIKVDEDLSAYANFNMGFMNDNFIVKGTTVSITGFPIEVDNTIGMGVTKYTGNGYVRECSSTEIYVDVDASAGNSGSPIYVTSTYKGKTYYTVIGIYAYGILDNSKYNGGTRINSNLLHFYKNNPNI